MLHAVEQRHLDGFQARCLRKILGVRPAYLSRVANRTILEQSKQMAYTCQLLKQQLLLYGKVARSPQEGALRGLAFCNGSLRPAADRFVRRVGRPKDEWARKLNEAAQKVAGNNRLEDLVYDENSWNVIINRYFKV